MEARKVDNFISQNNDLIENLKKKRPNLTRLDIEKLFEQSIQLTQIHRKLVDENRRLKKDFQKVEQAKIQRQQFISQVQKIVKEKSHELSQKNPHQSSWLVFKLQQKIFSLKQQIETKDKAIRKLHLSKQNQILLKKQIEVECLREINQFAEEIGILNPNAQPETDQDLEEIVWMDDFLETQKQRIEELESQLEQQDRETKRLLTMIGIKKAEIKRLRDVQRQYVTVQQNFMQQKKKKEEKTVDNKSFLANLMKQRDQQTEKLQKLKQKRSQIEAEETAEINKLQQRLEFLEKFYNENKGNISKAKQKSDVCIKPQSKEQWVKRVSIAQVETFAKNLNHCLALRGVDQEKWVLQFFKDEKPTYSIEQIINKLGAYPFLMSNSKEKTLLARYVVEDNDTGLMLEDMNTSQDSPIIKSILIKLIGPIKVYTIEQAVYFKEDLGSKLSKYWSLVEQSVHIKEGVRNLITREMLLQGINEAELELSQDELNFIVLYLFSWSRDINKLELNKLGKLKDLGINFSNQQVQS